MSQKFDNDLLNLDRVVSEFLLSRKVGGCSRSTLEYYRDELRWLVDYLASQNVHNALDITSSHIRGFLLAMSERRSPGGVHICHRVSKTFLRWIASEYEPVGWKNPIENIKPPKLGHEPLPPVNLDDLRKMLETCDKSLTGTRDRAIMLVLLDSGLRAFELLALDLEDIQDDTVTVRRGKGGKSRTVFIGDKTRQELNRYLRHRGMEAGPLWVTDERTPLSMNGLKTIVRRRAQSAGVPKPGIHAFRRGFAVAMLKAGADLVSIQRLLGHSQLGVTQRYLRLELSDLQAAHKKHGPVNGLFKKR